MLDQQTPTSPQQQSTTAPDSVVPVVSPPDSTSYYYHSRADASNEFAWLNQLLVNDHLVINSTSAPVPPTILSRRALLSGKTATKATIPVVTATNTPDSTPVVTTDTLQVDSVPNTTISIDTVPLLDTASQASTIDSNNTIPVIDSLISDTLISDTLQQTQLIDSLSSDSVVNSIVADSSSTNNAIHFLPKKQLIEEISQQENKLSQSLDAYMATTDWMLVVLIATFITATWAKVTFSNFFSQMFRSLFFYNESYKIYRENNIMARRFYLMLGTVFNINMALFLFMAIEYSNTYVFDIGHMLYLPALVLIVTVTYVIKKLVLQSVGQLFMAYRVAEEYWFSLSTINRTLGLALFPLLLAIPFTPDIYREYVFTTSWSLIGISFVFRLIRVLRITHEKQLSLFYMILYFCTLEILPIAVLYKYLSSIISGL